MSNICQVTGRKPSFGWGRGGVEVRRAEPWLEQVDLLDCTGLVSHTLTLRIDATVEIRFREGHVAVVDPTSRRCLTPGMHIHDDLLDAAASLRPA